MMEWSSKPLLLGMARFDCGKCERSFEVYAYHPEDVENLDHNIGVLRLKHVAKLHPTETK